MAIKLSSTFITIEQQRYHIQRTKVALPLELVAQIDAPTDDFVPLTAISWQGSTFTHIDLKKVCVQYGTTDDVWCPAFASLVLLLLPSHRKIRVARQDVLQVNNSKSPLPIGPLVIERSTGRVYTVSKLVPDTHHAFISAIIPGRISKSGFREFPQKTELEIAIPSRLYFRKSADKPLAGLRVGVKDTIALKGLRTGYGSQAWTDTYPPETYTSPCVQRLLNAGAIIVGKNKSSEFAEGVDPLEWTEGVCPFNPRGDGQQKPSSSSTGSASAMAAYEWLDVTYGTDTGGSIRHPAGVQGLFGQRPSHGIIDTTGVLGATPLFNTVGIFARAAKTFTEVGSYLVDPEAKARIDVKYRKYNLLYPTRAPYENNRDPFHGNQLRWFPHGEAPKSSYSEAEKEIETVVSSIEAELKCKRVPFNVDELWRATHPIGQPRSIDEATGFIYGVITAASACKLDIDQFVRDYRVANDDRDPPISNIVGQRFEYGRRCTNEKFEAALGAAQAFREWVLSDLFGSLDQDATTLLIFPQSWGRPDYRDEGPEQPVLFTEAFSIYSFAYLCGCPDYTIPVAEVPHHSPITNQVEYLPVSISLLSRPGTDLELFGVVDYLHEKGVISDVMAGSRMYANSPSVSVST